VYQTEIKNRPAAKNIAKQVTDWAGDAEEELTPSEETCRLTGTIKMWPRL